MLDRILRYFGFRMEDEEERPPPPKNYRVKVFMTDGIKFEIWDEWYDVVVSEMEQAIFYSALVAIKNDSGKSYYINPRQVSYLEEEVGE